MKRFIKTLAAIAATTIVFAACSNIMDDLKVRPASQPEPTPTPAPVDPNLSVPLTLEAAVAGAVVTFDNKASGPVTYKVNGGAAQTIASGESKDIALAATGDKAEFWGNNKAYATDDSNYTNITCSDDCYIYGNMMSLIKSVGFEKETVLEENSTFYRLFEHNACIKNKEGSDLLLPATTLAPECYGCMFQGCRGLTKAPTLPATSLAEACYGNMFSDCKSLASAPALPATSLARRCYAGMFAGSNLTTAPTLPAMTLAERCYDGMFQQCANLATAPALPATTLTESCYYGMFFDCKSLTSAPALPATTLAKKCYGNMFFGCKGLTSAPILPATTLAEGCYRTMFYFCEKLSSVTCLATNISAKDCTKDWLKDVAASGTFTKADGMTGWTTDSASGIPSGWTVRDFSYSVPLTLEACVAGATVTFDNKATGPVTYKVNGGEAQTIASGDSANITLAAVGDKVEFFGDNKAYATYNYSNYSHIACDKDCYVYGNIMSLIKSEGFENATALENAYTFAYLFKSNAHIKNKDGARLLLPATTLAERCYSYMFSGCASLTTAPSLPAATLAYECYRYMFEGCAGLTSAPELPATTLANYCYCFMFSGCASLKAAPSLPAATLKDYCYYYMFLNCASLASVTCLATNISAEGCTKNWLENVAASGTFTKAAGATWPEGINGIPSGWTVVEK